MDDRSRGVAIEPALDFTTLRIERDTKATVGPAVVRNRNKEARRQSIERADFAADERDTAAESHRADAELVHLAHDRRLEIRKPRIRIHVVERTEQLFFGVYVT